MAVIERFNIDDVMARMDKGEIANLPIGAVELDRTGGILFYNQAEADITNRSQPNSFVGKNFFREVAPCTNRPEFKGRFDEIATGAKSLAMFDYTFDYNMRPTRMSIQMKKSTQNDSIWVFVKRL
ncbi:MAG: PAS domain-containing protein [Acidobacteria bacterium]|nr:PAS domain-containing protein [Acidobacteriota bacterium]